MKPQGLKAPHSWEEREPRFYEGVFFVPDFFTQHEAYSLPAWEEIFGEAGPVRMEVCSGNGDWVVQKALAFPEIKWIAVEKRFDRVRKIWSKMRNHGLKNLLIVFGEALTFSQNYLGPRQLDEVYINFPDPWPKKRHAKHRLMRNEFFKEVSRLLHTKGKLSLATDDFFTVENGLEAAKKAGCMEPAFPEPGYLTDLEGYGSSWFEDLWREKGRKIHYVQWKNKAKALQFTSKRGSCQLMGQAWKPDFSANGNAQCIRLEGGAKGKMDWAEGLEAAEKAVKSRKLILWELDLGLAGGLEQPLGDQGQFQALALTIENFKETVYQKFMGSSLGICLYRGGLESFGQKPWFPEDGFAFKDFCSEHGLNESEAQSKRLFCRDRMVDYLDLLSIRLPEALPSILQLSVGPLEDKLQQVQLLAPDAFENHILISDGPQGLFLLKPGSLGGFQENPLSEQALAKGLCLPPAQLMHPQHWEVLREGLEKLEKEPHRFISETFLTMDWDGLDELFSAPEALGNLGLRKLQGFAAAGGEVYSLTSPLAV